MRPLAAIGLLAAGAVTGVATLALHMRWWGLALAVAAVVVVLVALPAGWWSRLPFVVGWVVPVLGAGLFRGPGGDVVVAAGPSGYTLLVTALVLTVATALTLPRRGGRRPDAAGSGPASPTGEDDATVGGSA